MRSAGFWSRCQAPDKDTSDTRQIHPTATILCGPTVKNYIHPRVVQEKLKHARGNWLPQLLQKVTKVSKAFSENFARIGSVGEVALHEDGENYEQYAIHIKVKFRDEGALEVRLVFFLIDTKK